MQLGQWVESDLSASTSLKLFYSHPTAFRPLNRMFGHQADGCGQCGIFGILGFSGTVPMRCAALVRPFRDLVFGHAARDRLEDVWNGNPVLQDLREGLPSRLQGTCGECLMKSVCLGSCVAQNFYRSKSLWAPNWYCEEAAKRTLFPETRMFVRR